MGQIGVHLKSQVISVNFARYSSSTAELTLHIVIEHSESCFEYCEAQIASSHKGPTVIYLDYSRQKSQIKT